MSHRHEGALPDGRTPVRRWATQLAMVTALLALAFPSRACETPVAGTAEAWRHRGQFKGYHVEAGCLDSPVVVVGGGTRWLDDVPPRDGTRKRLVAITSFYHVFLEPRRASLDSWNGFSHGRACLPEGEFAVIALQDWRDVDTAARLAGEALAAAGLAERVGIRLAPFTCSDPTKDGAGKGHPN